MHCQTFLHSAAEVGLASLHSILGWEKNVLWFIGISVCVFVWMKHEVNLIHLVDGSLSRSVTTLLLVCLSVIVKPQLLKPCQIKYRLIINCKVATPFKGSPGESASAR